MIHYIGFYADENDTRELKIAPSGITKMNYIISALLKNNEQVRVFSPAFSRAKRYKIFKKRVIKESNNLDFIYPTTFGTPNILMKIFAKIFMEFQLFKYLISIKDRSDIIIMYHSLAFIRPFKLYKFFKKNTLVFEVEELFTAVYKSNNFLTKREVDFLSMADKYIYVNDIMDSKFNFKKPYSVAYGNYSISEEKKQIKKDSITLIYAGVISGEKSDVYLAIETMAYLSDQYKLAIAGYGTPESIANLNRAIKEANSKNNNQIRYVGYLTGEEYANFLRKGDIGLSTRVLDNQSSDFTFPSKILVYLSHGLIPLSTNIDCVVNSKIKDNIIIVNSLKPKEIAKEIMNLDLEKAKLPYETLKGLDDEFVKSLGSLINNK